MINSSRGIIYAGKGTGFANAAREQRKLCVTISTNASTIEEIKQINNQLIIV